MRIAACWLTAKIVAVAPAAGQSAWVAPSWAVVPHTPAGALAWPDTSWYWTSTVRRTKAGPINLWLKFRIAGRVMVSNHEINCVTGSGRQLWIEGYDTNGVFDYARPGSDTSRWAPWAVAEPARRAICPRTADFVTTGAPAYSYQEVSRWQYLTELADQDTAFIDVETAVRNPLRASAWLKLKSSDTTHTIVRWEFDCKKRLMRTSHRTMYERGKATPTQRTDTAAQHVVPESVGESTMRTLCGTGDLFLPKSSAPRGPPPE